MNPLLQSAKSLSTVALLLGSSVVAAAPVYVQVGQTKVVSVSREVRAAKAADPELVEVSKKAGGQVVLRGRELGRTEVRLRTSDGEEYTLALHVVPEGATVYSTERGATGGARLARAEKQTVTSDADKNPEREEAQAKQAETDLESWAGAQP